MRVTFIAAAAAFAMAISAAGTAQAAPSGSYEQTCTNIGMNGDTLTATCKTFSGSMNSTSLPFATSCVGVISNVDGNLACTGPTGSYALTCQNASVSGDKLTASCKRINGSWMTSTTRFSGFQHPVTNCDGTLVDRPTC